MVSAMHKRRLRIAWRMAGLGWLMDIATGVGILGGIATICAIIIIDGGNFAAFYDKHAVIIIFGGSFAATFLRNGLTLDREAVEREALEAGRALMRKHPDVDAIVLECTNLPPYKPALQRALGVPIFDVLDLLRDFRQQLG